MIYDTKTAAWGRFVGLMEKRTQTFTAFWGPDSACGQMHQLGMLSDDEIRVLSPSWTGAIKRSKSLVENTVVGVTRRWEQHLYSAPLPPLQRCLMKAVLRIRWAKYREFLSYDVAGLFRCLKWRILLDFLHHILRIISDVTSRARGNSPLLQRERIKLKALKRKKGIFKAAVIAHNKAVITRLHVVVLENVLHPKNAGRVFVDSNDWVEFSSPDSGGVWRQMRTVPGVVTMQSLPQEMVKLPFSKNICHSCGVSVGCGHCRSCGQCRCARYCSRKCQRIHWREHEKVCELLLKKAMTYRFLQTTLPKEKDFPAGATLEKVACARAAGDTAVHGRAEESHACQRDLPAV